jgi:hypothetical protein
MEEKIKHIYGELRGMLKQAPDAHYLHGDDHHLWERLTSISTTLVQLTGDEDYSYFAIHPKSEYSEMTSSLDISVSGNEYRTKLGGLITRLHDAYFAEQTDPLSGAPSMVNNISQNQSVSVQLYVDLALELKSALERAETPTEKSFIQSLLDKVSTVKTFMDFSLLMNSLAMQFGITPDRVQQLFKFE